MRGQSEKSDHGLPSSDLKSEKSDGNSQKTDKSVDNTESDGEENMEKQEENQEENPQDKSWVMIKDEMSPDEKNSSDADVSDDDVR